MKKLTFILLMITGVLTAQTGKKVTDLTETTSVAASDIYYIIDGGVSKKVQAGNMLSDTAVKTATIKDEAVTSAKLDTGLVLYGEKLYFVNSLNSDTLTITIGDDDTVRFESNITIKGIGESGGGTSPTYWSISGSTIYPKLTSYNVHIGSTAAATEKLQVAGNLYASNFTTSLGTDNLFAGVGAGNSSAGDYNVFLGRQSGQGVSDISDNNTCVGWQSGKNLNGDNNTLIGYDCGGDNTIEGTCGNTGVGSLALKEISTSVNITGIGYKAGQNNGTGDQNVYIGAYSGNGNTSGNTNTYIGSYAGFSNTTGSGNIFMGYQCGYNETGSNKLYIENNSADNNNALIYGEFDNDLVRINSSLGIGMAPLYTLSVDGLVYADNFYGANNYIRIGRSTGKDTEGEDYVGCILIGYNTGESINADNNTFIGCNSGSSITTGEGNTVLGAVAGQDLVSGDYNLFLGFQTGRSATGSSNVFLGAYAGYNSTNSNTLIIDNSSTDSLIWGDFSADSVVINGDLTFTGTFQNDNSNIQWDDTRLKLLTGTSNIFIGTATAASYSGGTYNTVVGDSAGFALSASSYAAFLGTKAGYTNTGAYNTYLGSYSGLQSTTGQNNIYVGYNCAYKQGAGSDNNVVMGVLAGGGSGAASGCDDNVFTGYRSGYTLNAGDNNVCSGAESGYTLTSGSNNVFIGYRAGYSMSAGGSNIFIGANAGYNETGSGLLYIENSNSATPLIWGNFTADSVVINGNLNGTQKIYADSIYTIKAGAWADYVLEETYKLPTLFDKEQFIKQNGHLPNLKSGKELDIIADKNNGYLSQNEYNRRLEGLVKEVEELTLIIIEQQKTINELKNKIE